jgi:hypothetical protein
MPPDFRRVPLLFHCLNWQGISESPPFLAIIIQGVLLSVQWSMCLLPGKALKGRKDLGIIAIVVNDGLVVCRHHRSMSQCAIFPMALAKNK